MMRARDQRFLCDFPVEILLPDGEAWATIHDLGIGGAGLSGASGLRYGQGCTLVIDGRRMPATICWVQGDEFGVKFQRRLLPHEFDLITGIDAYAQVSGQSRRFGWRAA
jgi:PilZ domain